MGDNPSWLPSPPPPDRTTVAGARRARSEEMERRILEAGRKTFRHYGYDGSRVDDIVESAGVSHGAFYLYFRNKEDLLHRMAVECAARFQVLIGELESIGSPPSREEVHAWIRHFVAAYHDDGPVIRVWLDNRDSDPLMQALANDSLGPITRGLAALVDPDTRNVVGEPLAGLGMLSLLERLSSYYPDVDNELVALTATHLLFAATARPAESA